MIMQKLFTHSHFEVLLAPDLKVYGNRVEQVEPLDGTAIRTFIAEVRDEDDSQSVTFDDVTELIADLQEELDKHDDSGEGEYRSGFLKALQLVTNFFEQNKGDKHE